LKQALDRVKRTRVKPKGTFQFKPTDRLQPLTHRMADKSVSTSLVAKARLGS